MGVSSGLRQVGFAEGWLSIFLVPENFNRMAERTIRTCPDEFRMLSWH